MWEITRPQGSIAPMSSAQVPQIYGSFIMRTRDKGKVTTNLCLVMEYFEVGLDSLRSRSQFTERQVQPILQDLLCGIKYIHSKSYAHRDIKMSNVMFKANLGTACLIDYGFAVQVDPEPTMALIRSSSPKHFRID